MEARAASSLPRGSDIVAAQGRRPQTRPGTPRVIEVTDVIKRYGATPVLNGATFRIAEGQLTTILGPSGCGKSTMLRCLNRLERFDEGHIRIGDVEVRGTAAGRLSASEENDLVHRVRLRVGLVFQSFNLFPHLTALGNVIEAPITVKKIPRAQAEELGRLYLNLVGLSGREHEYPARLSGGQQQRVSIARALAMEPDVVLFDEPTSALDPRLVREVVALLRLLDDLRRTLVVVSHDMDFAQAISDQVIYFEGGRAVESGTARDVFSHPRRPETRAFMDSFCDGRAPITS
jgi:L-cystine transport system ATP-binding protein